MHTTGTGSMMCSISQSCPGSPLMYVPVDSLDGVSVNDVVSCSQSLERSCIQPIQSTAATPTSSPSPSPTPSQRPTTACVADTSIRINEFIVVPTSTSTGGANFEIRGPTGQQFNGKIVYLSSTSSTTLPNGDLLTTVKAEQIVTVSDTFDSNGLIVTTVETDIFSTFTVILCSDFALTTDDEIAVNFNLNPVVFAITDPSIFGTIYDVIGSVSGDRPTFYPVILSGDTYMGTYFTNVASNKYRFFVVFRDSCTTDLFAVSTFSSPNNVVASDGSEYQLSDFSFNPFDTSFGAVNPQRLAIA